MSASVQNSKTTFVTVNQRLPHAKWDNGRNSKTTFVTVNQKQVDIYREMIENSKTTFVTVNLYIFPNSNLLFEIQKQPLLLLINKGKKMRCNNGQIQKQPLLLLI